MKHLQKILKTEMKGMKFDKKSNEAPATALSSAKFLERTVFVEFLSVLTQTANSGLKIFSDYKFIKLIQCKKIS